MMSTTAPSDARPETPTSYATSNASTIIISAMP